MAARCRLRSSDRLAGRRPSRDTPPRISRHPRCLRAGSHRLRCGLRSAWRCRAAGNLWGGCAAGYRRCAARRIHRLHVASSHIVAAIRARVIAARWAVGILVRLAITAVAVPAIAAGAVSAASIASSAAAATPATIPVAAAIARIVAAWRVVMPLAPIHFVATPAAAAAAAIDYPQQPTAAGAETEAAAAA